MRFALLLLLHLAALRSVASFASRSKGFPNRSLLVLAAHNLKANSRNVVESSVAIPFLACPPVLSGCSLAGNVGFDPMGLAKSHDDLLMYSEMEIKHARLAMLVRTPQLCFRIFETFEI
jgi:Chlorophyll A-B binding protein